MNRNRGPSRLAVVIAVLLSLLLTVVPLPHWLELLRPDLVALTVLWLCILAPRTAGLFFAFTCGLMVDAFNGVVLGQHALALLLIAYVALRFHLRIRMFPLSQQALTVLSLLWLYEFVLFWIDGVTGHPVTDCGRWIRVLTGAALWPLIAGLYGRWLARR
jgi:rod shape-determining protein MreD